MCPPPTKTLVAATAAVEGRNTLLVAALFPPTSFHRHRNVIKLMIQSTSSRCGDVLVLVADECRSSMAAGRGTECVVHTRQRARPTEKLYSARMLLNNGWIFLPPPPPPPSPLRLLKMRKGKNQYSRVEQPLQPAVIDRL